MKKKTKRIFRTKRRYLKKYRNARNFYSQIEFFYRYWLQILIPDRDCVDIYNANIFRSKFVFLTELEFFLTVPCRCRSQLKVTLHIHVFFNVRIHYENNEILLKIVKNVCNVYKILFVSSNQIFFNFLYSLMKNWKLTQ